MRATGSDPTVAGLAAAQVEALERACDRFEGVWRAGRPATIENELGTAEGAFRAALLVELLVIDVHYRRRAGASPTPAEYHSRFPDSRDAVDAAFYSTDAATNSLGRPTGADTAPDEVATAPGRLKGLGGRAHAVGRSVSPGSPRFRVVRPFARGGLGEVFVAYDVELNREVALKEIQRAIAHDPTVRDRFLFEAEITGRLEHPGIVPVYGLGTYPDGRPYYAMKLVEGEPLADAVDRYHSDSLLDGDPSRRSLELRKLLRRLIDVCNAIEYAHGRGVVHRDIKPGNIIVGVHGETLLIDWGLAKASGRDDKAHGAEGKWLGPTAAGVAETLPGSALGTPAYMSPEQAAGELERIGRRSDVYGLGATLYYVLTGRPPFTGASTAEVLDAVKRGEFPRPRAVAPSTDRALEAVCLRAMALRPEGRYETPRALAEEIERWMADEPVAAWPAPFSLRARRWARRHRTAVTAGAVAVALSLVGLSSVVAVQSGANRELRAAGNRVTSALIETTRAKQRTEEALTTSEESRKQAEESRSQSEAVSSFLVEAFRSPDPSQDGRQVKVADVIDRAAARLEPSFSGSAVTKGALLDALGQTYYGLGLSDKSVGMFRRAAAVRESALGPDHLDTLRSRNNLAAAQLSAGRIAEAIELFEATLRACDAKLGPDHYTTIECRSNLGSAYWTAGRHEESIVLSAQTLRLMLEKFGPDHPFTLTARNNLAVDYRATGRFDEAVSLHEATLASRLRARGRDHPETLSSRTNLALAYANAGRVLAAIELEEVTLRRKQTILDAGHSDTLRCADNLARFYLAAGRRSDAIALHETTVRLMESKYGPNHPDTLTGRYNLAAAYESLGRWAESEALRRNVVAGYRKSGLVDGPDFADALMALASNLSEQARFSEALPLMLETLAIRERLEHKR
jgi:serine/threonine protein kinase